MADSSHVLPACALCASALAASSVHLLPGTAVVYSAELLLVPCRRIGGPVAMNLGDPVHMRLLVDHSCIECYLGSGEVLSTRIYRWGVLEHD